MNTGISVDFDGLLQAGGKLSEAAGRIGEIGSDIGIQAERMADMSLRDSTDILRQIAVNYKELADELFRCYDKLEKITDIYIQTEYTQMSRVRSLPTGILSDNDIFKGCRAESLCFMESVSETGTFYGHFISREDWLEKLIMDRRIK